MPETPEQKRIREENIAKLRGNQPPSTFQPNREAGDETRRGKSAMGGGGDAPSRASKGSREPKAASEEVASLQATIEDPLNVKQVPHSPKGLYVHFQKVVLKKWPDAKLLDLFGPGGRPNLKIMKFASDLLRDHKTEDLYEMIQVLVEDYEAFADARMFVKYYKGYPHATFEQLRWNDELLKTLIGRGVSGPNHRYSHYLAGYKQRYPEAAVPGQQEDDGKPVDIQAILKKHDQD